MFFYCNALLLFFRQYVTLMSKFFLEKSSISFIIHYDFYEFIFVNIELLFIFRSNFSLYLWSEQMLIKIICTYNTYHSLSMGLNTIEAQILRFYEHAQT